jgi:hypothetical protein
VNSHNIGVRKKKVESVHPLSTKELESSDPWELYIYAIKAPATKAKYCQRLRAFLDFLGYDQGSLEDKARAFAAKARGDSNSFETDSY